MASEGLRLFVESGKSEALDELSHIEGGAYDEFTAPPIDVGEGETEAKLFVDGKHSQVTHYEIDLK